jgi:drug/metabolite transporter superfamily protein YnfA
MSALYEMIGRFAVWSWKRRAAGRLPEPPLTTVIAVAIAGALVGLLGVGLLLGNGSGDDEPD